MEPEVARLYSYSPPPLDESGEEEEEEEDDFGEFGGFVSSSFSFSEFDSSTTFAQSHEVATSPPGLNNTFVPNVDDSGKESVHEEMAMPPRASNVEPSSCQSDVVVDCLEERLETSEFLTNGILPSDSMQELSVVPKTMQHRLSTTEQQESNSTYRKGHRQSKHNTHTEQELSVVMSFNSTENVEVLGTVVPESSSTEAHQASSSQALLVSNTSQRAVPESKDTVAMEELTEPKAVSPNKPGVKQSHKEGSKTNRAEEAPGLGQDGPKDLGALVDGGDSDGTSDIQEDGKVHVQEVFENMVEVPLMVTGMVVENFKEVNTTLVDPIVNAIHAAEADEVMSEGKATSDGFMMDEKEDFSGATQDLADLKDSDETFADFITAQSGCFTDDDDDDEFRDADILKDFQKAEVLSEGEEDNYKSQEWQSSELAPSESFADFSSVPFEGPAGGDADGWAAFEMQKDGEVQQESWAAFKEQQNTTTVPPTDGLQTDNLVDGLHKLQLLFENTFSSKITSEDSIVPSLHTLLKPENHSESRVFVTLWRHLLDIHNAHGLKVQWAGSRSNRILLDCLGFRNILFTGQNKQPMIMPMFAAGLGMLEPTKNPVKLSPTFSAPSSSQGRSTLCTQVVSSLSHGEDAPSNTITYLNLDFFGPVEECSSDSGTETPMPGLDPDLYELTTAKLESNDAGSNAFNKLMESIEKHSTVNRKPERDEDISREAAHVLSLLPDLSFMHSRVLMIPSTLNPASNE